MCLPAYGAPYAMRLRSKSKTRASVTPNLGALLRLCCQSRSHYLTAGGAHLIVSDMAGPHPHCSKYLAYPNMNVRSGEDRLAGVGRTGTVDDQAVPGQLLPYMPQNNRVGNDRSQSGADIARRRRSGEGSP
jgi:hypothetical protein